MLSLQSRKWAYLDVVPVSPKLNLPVTPDPKRRKRVAEKKTLEVSMRLLSECLDGGQNGTTSSYSTLLEIQV